MGNDGPDCYMPEYIAMKIAYSPNRIHVFVIYGDEYLFDTPLASFSNN